MKTTLPKMQNQIISIQKGIITNKLFESKKFYQDWLYMDEKFESDWFLLMNLPDKPEFELAFMLPNLPSVQKQYFQEPYAGNGIWLIMESLDVRKTYREMLERNAPIDLPLTEEEWGDVHFTLVDPNGIGIDIVQLRTS